MKSTRRVLTAILALAMVLTMSLNLFAIPNDYNWAAQNRAKDAYQVLYNAVYSKNNRPMRDDFAGAWVTKEELLYVAVTENGDLAHYQELLRDYDCVVFLTVKYSYNMLSDLSYRVMDHFIHIDGIYVNSAWVEERTNTMGFTTPNDAETTREHVRQYILSLVEQEGLPKGIEDAFEIQGGVIIEPTPEDDEVSVNRPTESRCAAESCETV